MKIRVALLTIILVILLLSSGCLENSITGNIQESKEIEIELEDRTKPEQVRRRKIKRQEHQKYPCLFVYVIITVIFLECWIIFVVNSLTILFIVFLCLFVVSLIALIVLSIYRCQAYR